MNPRNLIDGLRLALREVRPPRLVILLLVSLAAACASDWLREERVIFPAPLPQFITVPSGR